MSTRGSQCEVVYICIYIKSKKIGPLELDDKYNPPFFWFVVGSFTMWTVGEKHHLHVSLSQHVDMCMQHSGEMGTQEDCIIVLKLKGNCVCTHKRATFFKITSPLRYCDNVCAIESCGRRMFHFCCDVDPLLLFSHWKEYFVTEDGIYIMRALCGRPS